MRIGIITRGDVFPEVHGAAAKIVSTARFLSKLGISTFMITSGDDFYYRVEEGNFYRLPLPKWIKIYPQGRKFGEMMLKILQVPRNDWLLYFPIFDINLWVKALFVARREKLSILQAEFTAFGFPAWLVARILGIKCSIVEHNVECMRMEEQNTCTRRCKWFTYGLEKFLCKSVDFTITVSTNDKDRLIQIGVPGDKISVIPHGVNMDIYDNLDRITAKAAFKIDGPMLVYHGDYSYAPNIEAAQTIACTIIPALRKAGINATALLIGRNPPLHLENEGVIFAGVVNDLPKYIAPADVAVVPLRSGGGTRLKLFEYLAAGVPIVSTPKGAEGFEVKNGEEMIIVDSEQEMIEAIIMLLNNPEKRAFIAEKGRQFVKRFHWLEICKEYQKLYANSLK